MPDLRDMELLAALARNRHFARAATECGISQPAFSARIRNMELDLGAAIVQRGNRFVGFTPEGEIALKWAHQMIADARGLRQEINEAKGALTGELTIGSVPTALTYVAQIAADLMKAHPALTIRVLSHSSAEIVQGLEAFSLDAGVTYMEGAAGARDARPIYLERYEVLAPADLAEDRTEITWTDAAALPLCLLPRTMLNRRFMDDAFQSAGVAPNLVMETNAFTAALVQVQSGTAATIAPEMLIEHAPLPENTARLKLTAPVIEKQIGIVVAQREPRLPAVHALLSLI
ncbi:MAG: LysR family transcriptional regulator [Pseudomonadota bacterium]